MVIDQSGREYLGSFQSARELVHISWILSRREPINTDFASGKPASPIPLCGISNSLMATLTTVLFNGDLCIAVSRLKRRRKTSAMRRGEKRLRIRSQMIAF